MTNEQIREKLASLKNEQTYLIYRLDKLVNSGKNLSEKGLRKEANLRKKIDSLQDEIDELEAKLEKNEKGLSVGQKLALTLGIIGLCGILGVVIGKSAKKNCAPTVKATPDKTISANATPEVIPYVIKTVTATPTTVPATQVPTAVPTPVPTATPIPEDVLVDVTDDENVAMVAEKILTKDIKAVLEKNPTLSNFATVEAIEDIIRMVNGELPAYSNYDEYTIGKTANLMNDIFANQGNHNDLYPMDFSKLYPENSVEAKYIKTYDDIYRKIAEYRAEGNGDGFVEQVGLLGSKIYNEWHLAGLYGGWNPYLFPYQEQYFLLQASTSRFSNYVREYLEANDLTVCIPTCYDVENEEHKLVEVRDIFEALYMGTSRNKAISVVDETGNVINIFAETFADAKNYLDARANVKVKGLN